MTARRRHLLLFALLIASAALVGYDRLRPARAAGADEAVVRPVPRGGAVPAAPDPAGRGPASVGILRSRSDYVAGDRDAFPSARPAVAAAPVPVAEPAGPPAPSAPPMPFTVIGKKFDGGSWEVYLAKGDASYVAAPGSVLGGEYRVTEIVPPTMTMIYLPLNEKQTLQIGASLHE